MENWDQLFMFINICDFRILVGAPRDNVTDASAPSQVRNLKSPGVIYTCPVSSFKDDCESVEIDREGKIRYVWIDRSLVKTRCARPELLPRKQLPAFT